MNRHIFLDNLTILLGALILGKKKYFSNGLQSKSFEDHVAAVNLKTPQISGNGIFEVHAETLIGELDPAFRVAQWLGGNSPTIIYHHGNNERPFEFKKSAKNTFNSIFINNKNWGDANLIVVRAPFHNGSIGYYQDCMLEISNFIAMIATSVTLNEEIINEIRKVTSAPIITSGISLGGWVTNLHRGIFNTSTAYAPLMAGAYLGEVFLKSKYRRMASDRALEDPQEVRRLLNFEKLFRKQQTQNVYPLLARYDQLIDFDVQKETYKGYPLKTMERGHITGALSTKELQSHLLSVLKLAVDKK
ncbi:MAG TPA: hypothetical protein VK957_04810 [Lunatimonas sp.]|nr:hypothetical protein [Lunatimonas sp.]